jgi:hypothetical protein
MEEGRGLTPGEGGSHGGLGAAARRCDAGDGGYLASDGGRGRGRNRGLLGLSGPGGQVGWAVVSVRVGRQAKAEKWLGRLRRGGGHEEVGLEGRARPAGLNGSKGRKYLGQISSGLWSNEI